jgi:glycosyltransferase involved in cell wall biosynthesis
MKKLLYITDQDEYVDHSFIAPLFETYLKKYLTVDILYFTEFKSDFERKDSHRFTMPTRYKNVLLDELNRNDVSMDSYDYVMVRNDISIMKLILEEKKKYHYKTAFRLSIPKRRVQLRCCIAEGETTIVDKVTDKFKTFNETKIINACDAFLPTSHSMHKEFFPNVTTQTILCPPGIDPNMLHPNIQHQGEEKRFFYSGTLDKVREFETVLEAFSQLSSDTWKLSISTRDPEYAHELISQYKGLEKNVDIHNAKTKDELLDLIAKADIGVALLPDYPVYNTSTPVKIFDYYTSAIPCIMTGSNHTNTIFTDCTDAWFCKFEREDIKEKLEYIISLSKESIAEVGMKGQKRLLEIKNYEKIAEDIAMKLEAL